MSLKPYPKYKDSGVAWLGEVPEGWEILPFYSVARERDEPNKGMVENNLLSLSYGRIIRKDMDSNDGLLPESFETYQVVRQGDIIFRLTDLQNDKRSLRTAIVSEVGIITSAYLAAMPFGINPNYFNYLLRSYDVKKVFYSMGGGLRQSMKFSDIKRLPILTPSKGEQIAITNFLDTETAKIDELIAEQEKLIALLAEKRQATISHAVTKGLNPAAPMKDSGIEWLGEVPEGWSISRFSRIIDRIKDGTHGTYDRVSEGIPLLSAKNVQFGFIDVSDSESLISESDYLEITSNGFPSRGDILMTIVGTIGRVCVFENDEPYAFQRSVCFIRLSNNQSSKYFYYFLQSKFFQVQLNGRSKSSAQAGVYMGDVVACDILYPSQYEAQLEIVKFLDAELAKLDILYAEANRAIDLLKERRTALISAAVTGKIDVREMAKVIPFPIDRRRVRGLVATEIIENLSRQPTFGRVMLQKAAYLAETFADISELEGHYLREAAGPLDRNMIDEMEAEAGNWARVNISQIGGVGTAVKYRTTGQIGKHKNELKEVLGQDRAAKLRRIINIFIKLDTATAEAYATIFAVWNDFLIDGLTPSDDEIINGVLNDWHPEKRNKFKFSDLKIHLGKMRELCLVPTGLGKKTETGRLFT